MAECLVCGVLRVLAARTTPILGGSLISKVPGALVQHLAAIHGRALITRRRAPAGQPSGGWVITARGRRWYAAKCGALTMPEPIEEKSSKKVLCADKSSVS